MLKKINSCMASLFILIAFISILAWITSGTIEGVLGVLAYAITGALNVFPWFIPFIGIPLGILDVLDIYGFNMRNLTLDLAHVSPNWMTDTWYLIIIIVGCVIQLFLILKFLKNIARKRNKKIGTKSNLALINCHVIDGNLGSPVIENGVILIKNKVNSGEIPGLIIAVGKSGEVQIPDDYKKIDLKGSYILPGLINAHCHLSGSGKPLKLMNLSESMMDKLASFFKSPVGMFTLERMIKNNITNALHAGVTTLRSMSDPFYSDLRVKEQIENGTLLGPRLVCAGMGIRITGGHGGMMSHTADSAIEIKKIVRYNVRKKVDFIKILSTGGIVDSEKIGEAGRPQMTVEEIKVACDEAHRASLLVATHCESPQGIKEALTGGVDSIEHGSEIPAELVSLFKRNPNSLRGFTTLTSTVSAGMGLAVLPKEETNTTYVKKQNAILICKGMIKGLQTAYKEGIPITVGTDATVAYSTHYDMWKELKYMMKYTGMSAGEAIHFATKNNAINIGIGDITGSIEEGKSADIQVVPGNPLEDIEQLAKVSKIIMRGNLINHPIVKKIKDLKDFEPIEL